MHTGDAREIRFHEFALFGETPQTCLLARDSGLAGAEGDPDTLQGRIDHIGEEQQAAANSAADVDNPKLSSLDRRGARPGLLRDETVHVVDCLPEGFDSVGPYGAPQGKRLSSDPKCEKKPRVFLIVRSYSGNGIRSIASHNPIVAGVAKRCKTMYP